MTFYYLHKIHKDPRCFFNLCSRALIREGRQQRLFLAFRVLLRVGGGILVDTLVLSPDDTKCRSATVYAEAKFPLLSDGQPPSS